MKIKKIKLFSYLAGWRSWRFLKIETNENIDGWSDCTDTFGNLNGFIGVLKDFENNLIEEEINNEKKIIWKLKTLSKSNRGSLVQRVISSLENATLDILAKKKQIPVYSMFGKLRRKKIEMYWSHCGTTRVRTPEFLDCKPIKKLEDVNFFCDEINNSGFKTIKTNLALFINKPIIYMPGHKIEFNNFNLRLSTQTLIGIKKWIKAFNDNLNKDISIAVDLNFNFKKEDILRISEELKKFNIKWLEIDTYCVEDMLFLKKNKINHKIITGETLMFLDDIRKFIDTKCCDFISTDVVWSGFEESLKIANYSNKNHLPISTHNYNGDLGTLMSINLAAIVKNFAIGEIDIDEVNGANQIFTNKIKLQKNYIDVPQRPGWGTDLIEKKLKIEYQV